MNKTVAANIGGFVFNVEEQAFETLNAYLRAVRRSLGSDESADEIMNDIELRMAELFKDILFKEKREVISSTDVQYIMEVMGAPEVYAGGEQQFAEEKHEGKPNEQKSGSEKQMFRDADNRIFGGVCSGLSAYMGWDPVLLRIIFVLLFFIGGGGFLIYIVLWIIIPEAKTTADKMKMRGEKINVEGIKNKFKDIRKDVGNIASEENKRKIKDGANQVAGYFERTVRTVGQVLGRSVGFVLIVFALIFLVIFLRALFTNEFIISVTENGIHSYDFNEFGELIFGSKTKSNIVFLSLILMLLVPVISVILWGIRLVFKTNFRSKPLNITLGLVAGVSITTLIVMAVLTVVDFSKEKELDSYTDFRNYNGDTIYVEVSRDPYFSDHYEHNGDDFTELMRIEDKKIIYGYPGLNVTRASGNEFRILVTKTAHGSTQREAIHRAENIEYHFTVSDSLVRFDPYFTVPRSDLIRAQQVYIEVQVPEGKAVYLGKGSRRIIYDIQNNHDVHDSKMEGHYWVMRPDGLEETWR